MTKLFRGIFFVLITTTVLYNCSPQSVYDETIGFDSLIWNRFNTIEMEVPVQADEKGYNFMVILHHNDDYSFDFIRMNITFYMPGGGMRSRDYQFKLQDEPGNWLGEPANGFHQIELPLLNGLKFSEDGICKVRIENKMIKFNTIGVKSLGLVVKKAK
jgi:gliding motility-associated lipoprotein GldH